jgi:acyl carrier protein
LSDIEVRLIRCFAAVFPGLSDDQIVSASVDTVEAWDSVAAATLVSVIEEEFGIEFNEEILVELT